MIATQRCLGVNLCEELEVHTMKISALYIGLLYSMQTY